VNDDAIDAFYNFLCLEKPKPYARERVQALVRCWNKLSLERTAWPDVKLSLLPPLPKHGLTEGEFSKNFIDDLQYYRESALSGRLPTQRNRRFSETSKEKVEENPLREGSVDTYIRFLRLGASFLAKCRGAPLKSIEKLSGLLVPGAPEDIMEEAYNYYGKTRSLPSLLSALFSVAKWHVGARPDIIGRLETLREHLPHFDETMTDKYRRLLRELEPHDYAILYSLPTRIMKKIDRRIEAGKFLRRRDISEAKTAACIAILLYTPIRIKNLAAIKISENFILGRDLARLRFVAADTKQKREIDLPVHPNTIPVIRWYINNILPLVRRGGCTALFPGKSKATMSEDGLRNVIERVLEVHLRRLNPHFFRHLAAHVMLLEEPGCYAQIQILLGHRRIETTMKYYCGEEAEAALQHVARCLSAASEKFIMLAEGRSNVR
jgi:integrase